MCERTKSGRIPCLVLGCRRTARADRYPPNTEIICAKCWRLVPKYLKRRARRLERIMRRLKVEGWGEAPPGTPARRVLVLHRQAWRKIRRAVIEARVGIG